MRGLLVASAGGHLSDLHLLRRRMHVLEHVVWVTFENSHARSLLRGEEVVWVENVPSRDLSAAVKAFRPARRIIRERRPDIVISTGAALALPYLLAGRMSNMAAHYIECSARWNGPSLTGRLLMAVPGVTLHTQSPTWTTRRWRYSGSVFDGFTAMPRAPRGPNLRVVVTVGTSAFGFERLLNSVAEALPIDSDVTWQIGHNRVPRGFPTARAFLEYDELAAAMAAADVVVCHAGVGSALLALSSGHCPILVARRSLFGEAVDNHQLQVADALAQRQLALHLQAEEITAGRLVQAAHRGAVMLDEPPPFRL